MADKKKIIWKTNLASFLVASVRYRCLLPAIFLKDFGYESVVLQRDESVEIFDNVKAIIFVKTFSKHDLELAKKANEFGIPIYIDLCDNIFISHYVKSPAYMYFNEISALAKAIVTTGVELSKLIEGRLHQDQHIAIIPDQVEYEVGEMFLTGEIKVMRKARFKLMRGKIKPFVYRALNGVLNGFIRPFKSKVILSKNYLINYFELLKSGVFKSINQRKFNKGNFVKYQKTLPLAFLNSDAKTVIWFGNAGKDFSDFGLSSLASIADELITLNKTIPIKLLVVSSNIKRYQNLIEPLPLITAYKPWNYNKIFEDIASADVFVAPNSQDEFSLCKSPNRTLLALSLGVPVVATSMPSLGKISEHIVTDDWQYGLITYLTDIHRVNKDISAAKTLLDQAYSGKAIATLWVNLLINR